MKAEDTEALGKERAKLSKIKARYSRLTCKNCSQPCTFVHHYNKCKKLRFRHKLTANDTSKTAKITKR